MTEPRPDFTFDPAVNLTAEQLQPLYAAILGPGPAPVLSLGAVSTRQAWDWLSRQHRTYADAVGHRSGLIKAMRLPERVVLVGASDGG